MYLIFVLTIYTDLGRKKKLGSCLFERNTSVVLCSDGPAKVLHWILMASRQLSMPVHDAWCCKVGGLSSHKGSMAGAMPGAGLKRGPERRPSGEKIKFYV